LSDCLLGLMTAFFAETEAMGERAEAQQDANTLILRQIAAGYAPLETQAAALKEIAETVSGLTVAVDERLAALVRETPSEIDWNGVAYRVTARDLDRLRVAHQVAPGLGVVSVTFLNGQSITDLRVADIEAIIQKVIYEAA